MKHNLNMDTSGYCFQQLANYFDNQRLVSGKQKQSQILAGSILLNGRICCFCPSFMTGNEEYFVLEQVEDVSLGTGLL